MTTTRTPTPSAAVAARFTADRRRRRVLWSAVIVVAVLLAAVIVGYQRFQSQSAEPVRYPSGTAAHGGTGVARGSGAVTIDVYADFMCPNCKQFEDSAATVLDSAVTAGRVTVVTHPVAFLDRMSRGTKYSTRATAAAGCAADGGRFTEYVRALFQRQPAERTPGLTDDRLIALGQDAGLTDSFAQCVRDGTYRGWAAHVSEQAARAGVIGTPTVKVNGKVTDADPAALRAALGDAG